MALSEMRDTAQGMSQNKLPRTICLDSSTHSTDTMTSNDGNDNGRILSSDPCVAGLKNTPTPGVCEFCGEKRYTEGVDLLGRIFWFPGGAKSCTCPEGKAEYEREQAERKAQREAEEIAKADKEMRRKVQRVIGDSGMGERFLQRTFETFTIDTPDGKKIKAAVKDYAENFTQKLPKRGEPLPGRNGFLITGAKGTGKTHIAASVANYLLNQGIAAICMTERDLFGRIKRTYSPDEGNDESAVLEIYKSVPLLIIDDIGKERPTEWTLATLYAIIDGRYDRAMTRAEKALSTKYDRITPETLEQITNFIIDRFKLEEEGMSMRIYGRKLANTKLLLRNYRSLSEHSRNAVFRASHVDEDASFAEIMAMMGADMREWLKIESIRASTARTRIIIDHVDKMLELYRVYCEQSQRDEDKRRYSIIQEMYIAPKTKTPEDIALDENIDRSTVYRDVDAAIERLTALLFGIDGLSKIRK